MVDSHFHHAIIATLVEQYPLFRGTQISDCCRYISLCPFISLWFAPCLLIDGLTCFRHTQIKAKKSKNIPRYPPSDPFQSLYQMLQSTPEISFPAVPLAVGRSALRRRRGMNSPVVNGGSDKRSRAFGVTIFPNFPDIFPIQWGAIRSYKSSFPTSFHSQQINPSSAFFCEQIRGFYGWAEPKEMEKWLKITPKMDQHFPTKHDQKSVGHLVP